MKILSLFDGMACGALAMQAAGIEIDKYIAYEVDKYAIQTAKHNFPFIEERGDVFKADFTEFAGFDYLVGGSPCTYWSIAQTKNRETVASGMGWELFKQYVRALPTGKTNNLTTVSKDNLIAEPVNITKEGKAGALRATCYKDGVRNLVANTVDKKTCVALRVNESVKLGEIGKGGQGNRVYSIDGKAVAQTAQSGGMGSNTGLYAEPFNADDIKYCNDKNIAHICRPFGSKAKVITENEKAPTLMAAMGTGGGNGVYYAENMKVCEATNAPIYEVKDGFITVKGNKYPIKLVDGFYIIRKLTVRECMRLQTVPDWYEWPVSKSQAYKMLGNGWTVDIIAHIFKELKE